MSWTPFFVFFLSSLTWAGRPVYKEVDLAQLTSESELIIAGWPSPSKQSSPCGEAFGLWQINYIIKGDQTMQHKVISVYPSDHHIYSEAQEKGQKGPSYSALKYGSSGLVSKEQRSSILFMKHFGECWELAAAGAQEELKKDQFIRSVVNPSDCRFQKDAIRVFLNELPKDCVSDQDCQGMNLHPRSCERPRAYNLKASKMLSPDWMALAARARSACATEWGQEPACSPQPTDTYCKDHQCQLGTVPPSNVTFQEASLEESCAPSDAGSMSLVFFDGNSKLFPRLSINWWGASQPIRKAGAYTLSNGISGKTNKDFSASYCRTESNCAIIKEIYIKIQLNDSETGQADVEATTFKGDPIKLKAPVKMPQIKPRFCG